MDPKSLWALVFEARMTSEPMIEQVDKWKVSKDKITLEVVQVLPGGWLMSTIAAPRIPR